MRGLRPPQLFHQFAGILLLTTAGLATAMAETVVVVAASSEVSALSAEQARAIFLGKTTTMPSGTAAIPILQNDESVAHAQIREKVLKKSAGQLQSYWAQRIFSGKATPPKVADNDAEVKEYLAKTTGGIGYIDGSHVDGSVKVVLTVK
jgi:ABC-type phosphate transport system substrate-binding protein